MKRLPRVYIAAPYNGGKDDDVRRAIGVGDLLRLSGFTPFIPHLNHLWNLVYPHDSQFWRAWDNEWLPCCDVLFRVGDASDGADAEVVLAKSLGIPVIIDLLSLSVWRRDVWEKTPEKHLCGGDDCSCIDIGFEMAQESVSDWYEPEPPERC